MGWLHKSPRAEEHRCKADLSRSSHDLRFCAFDPHSDSSSNSRSSEASKPGQCFESPQTTSKFPEAPTIPAPFVWGSALPQYRRHLSLPYDASWRLKILSASPCSPSTCGLPGHRTNLTDRRSKLILPHHLQACPCPALEGVSEIFYFTLPSTPHSSSPSCHLYHANMGCHAPT